MKFNLSYELGALKELSKFFLVLALTIAGLYYGLTFLFFGLSGLFR